MNGMNVNTNFFLDNCPNSKVKSNFHKPFSLLNEFRNNGFLTDVSLIVGDTTFRAHKVVLACHSEVYSAMFNSDMLETQNNKVVITDVQPNVMSLYLNFMYTGVLPGNINIDDATELLMCADKYQTASLMFALDEILIEKMTPESAVLLLQLADSFNRIVLERSARSYIWSNLAKTMATESWKMTLPNNQEQMNVLLVDFHVKARDKLEDQQGSQRCSRNDIRHFRQTWRLDGGVEAFRPKGVKMYRSCLGKKPLNFIVVFSHKSPDSVVSLYPISVLPKDILVYCKVLVSSDGEFDSKREQQEHLLAWNPDQAHPTLGHRRVEIIRWNWWDTDKTSVDVELELQVYHGSEELPTKMTPTVVQEWKIDKESQEPPDSPMEIATFTEAKDFVFLIFGETRISVRRRQLLDRSRPHVQAWHHNEFVLPKASEATGRTIVRYLESGLFPPRDKVDLNLLETAWELQLGDLVMYTEQAIIWDLDTYNVVAYVNDCHHRAHSWLTWACAQYLKHYLYLVKIRDDEEWRNITFECFEILIKEMRNELHPRLLPNFMTAERS